MCGRYTLVHGLKELRDRFEFDPGDAELSPRYNLAPGQMAPVVVMENGRRVLRMMKWGLVPFWADDPKIGNRMINARGETVAQKPAFRRLLKRRRCLVLADGFYEWRPVPGRKGKFPMRIHLKKEPPFAFAGLCDTWKSQDGDELDTFTIITTSANEMIEPIHDRMPVILNPEDEDTWLDPDLDDTETLVDLLKPFPPDRMGAYDVSKTVNSPRNDSPECLEPVDEKVSSGQHGKDPISHRIKKKN